MTKAKWDSLSNFLTFIRSVTSWRFYCRLFQKLLSIVAVFGLLTSSFRPSLANEREVWPIVSI